MSREGQTSGADAPRERVSGVQSIDRAVQLLRCFTGANAELGISDLSRMTGLSTSTVHRLLASMQANHLVRQTPQRRYSLGALVVQLASAARLPSTLRTAALPLAKALCEEVNETIGIHELIPSGHRMVVDQVESHQELRRTYTEFGLPIRLVHGSPGKAILAFLPADEQERQLAEPVKAVTDRTVTDPEEIRAELARVRERGWAYSDAERTPGIRSIAAPVIDHGGVVIGAIGLSMPAIRVPDERVPVLGARVDRLGRDVSAALGATEESYALALQLASPQGHPCTPVGG